MSGQVVHFEIPADDLDRAREFYRAAFGWNLQSMAEVNYTVVSTTPTDDQGRPTSPGAINGGMFRRGEPVDTPIITIDVPDIDAALASVESLGGTIVHPKQAVLDMGYAAYFRDSEGNVMGLWENAVR
ncbi:VOC family protein [Jiangella asiatica]|uniref:VOC family protein n=1 Tax=Jiangella asiatica TaxID=2530372 RepID=A0A4R5C919_9ACTN|nr:VOC family protein [Jiangella asiatica]TDD95695.1 VOC family protein [Jiangella asiatica]